MVFDITKNELTFHTAIHKYIFLYTQLKKKKKDSKSVYKWQLCTQSSFVRLHVGVGVPIQR